MRILSLVILYRMLRDGSPPSINMGHSGITVHSMKKLRIRYPLVFKFISWFIRYFDKRVSKDVVNTPTYINSYLSTTLKHESGIDDYLSDICDTIPNWNLFTMVDKMPAIHETAILLSYNPINKSYAGFKESLQITCCLAYGLCTLGIATHRDGYKDYYARLLDGIDRCLIIDGDKHAILRHPSNIVTYELGPISPEVVACLALVISGFGRVNTPLAEELEFTIRSKFNAIMEYHDYFLPCDQGIARSFDLAPNALYTHIRCFAYSAVRMSQGVFNIDDAKILKQMLLNTSGDLEYWLDKEGKRVISTAILLEALLNMYQNDCWAELHQSFSCCEFATLALDWLERYRAASIEINPELEAILFIFYSYVGNNLNMRLAAHNIQQIINVMYDNRVTRKTENNRIRPDKEYFASIQAGKDIPLPPLYRRNASYYWYRDSCGAGKDNFEHPVFEYLTVYARIYTYVVTEHY